MKITIKLKDTLEQNAARYFEESKKAKKKMQGAQKAIVITRQKLTTLAPIAQAPQKKSVSRTPQWYEKFHWFYSSQNLLVIGGRDATTNEIIVKKHADSGDLVFHTDMHGSPFVVVKSEGHPINDETKQEAAQFCACHAKAWKLNMPGLDVFYVTPDQVSKTPQSGEFLPKGAFVIRGKTTYLRPVLEYAVGSYQGTIMGGPPQAIKVHCPTMLELVPGDQKTSDLAKIIQKTFGGDLDTIIRILPAGGAQFKKVR